MLRSKSAKAAAFGFLLFWVSAAGMLALEFAASQLGWRAYTTPAFYAGAVLIHAGMILSLAAAIATIVDWIRRRVLLKSGTAGVAAFGLVAFWAGLAWAEIQEYVERLRDQPGWITFRAPYFPPRILAVLGFLILLIAVIVSIVIWTYRRFRWGSANARRTSNP